MPVWRNWPPHCWRIIHCLKLVQCGLLSDSHSPGAVYNWRAVWAKFCLPVCAPVGSGVEIVKKHNIAEIDVHWPSMLFTSWRMWRYWMQWSCIKSHIAKWCCKVQQSCQLIAAMNFIFLERMCWQFPTITPVMLFSLYLCFLSYTKFTNLLRLQNISHRFAVTHGTSLLLTSESQEWLLISTYFGLLRPLQFALHDSRSFEYLLLLVLQITKEAAA